MIFTEAVKQFLMGSTISNGYAFEIGKSEMKSRDDILVNLSKAKRVLHVGCADHESLIEEKRKEKIYLHDKLGAVAGFLMGVDTNGSSLQKMRSLGIDNLFHVDDVPNDFRPDIVLVPDVIEHVGNVQDFLKSLRKYGGARVVLTTPNSFRLYNRLSFFKEVINSDHSYWFSPYTLCKVSVNAGYEIESIYYTDVIRLRRPIRSLLKWCFPLLRDGIIVVLK